MVEQAAVAPAGRHCAGCGATSCAGCLPDLDPPRYCVDCGTWLATRVSPRGVTAVCRRCSGA